LDILPGERVVICAENRPEWVYALYGIWQRGGIAVPVDFMSSPKELEYILRETEPTFVVCSNKTEESVHQALSSLGLKTFVLNLDRVVPPNPVEKVMSRGFQDTALILYTSGTTGEPKGVMLSFKNVISNLTWSGTPKGSIKRRQHHSPVALPPLLPPCGVFAFAPILGCHRGIFGKAQLRSPHGNTTQALHHYPNRRSKALPGPSSEAKREDRGKSSG
jgi:acyl-CoA synthetase (AMP-forming)/AMP-acid ligase II